MNWWSNPSHASSKSACWRSTGIRVLARDGHVQGQDHLGPNGSKRRLSVDGMEVVIEGRIAWADVR